MKKLSFGAGVALGIVAVLALALGANLPGHVDSPAPPLEIAADSRSLNADGSQIALAGDGGRTGGGILVHGDWTIEVWDPDGTLFHRREFHNDVAVRGPLTISRILAGANSPGIWRVELEDFFEPTVPSAGFKGPCEALGFAGGPNRPSHCIITEALYQSQEIHIFKNLSVSVPDAGANADALVLNGSAAAAVDGELDQVETFVFLCPSNVSAFDCTIDDSAATDIPQGVTGTSLDPPIPYQAGQQIQVTVVISFE